MVLKTWQWQWYHTPQASAPVLVTGILFLQYFWCDLLFCLSKPQDCFFRCHSTYKCQIWFWLLIGSGELMDFHTNQENLVHEWKVCPDINPAASHKHDNCVLKSYYSSSNWDLFLKILIWVVLKDNPAYIIVWNRFSFCLNLFHLCNFLSLDRLWLLTQQTSKFLAVMNRDVLKKHIKMEKISPK